MNPSSRSREAGSVPGAALLGGSGTAAGHRQSPWVRPKRGGSLQQQGLSWKPGPGRRLAAGLPLLGRNSSISPASSKTNVMKTAFFFFFFFLLFFFHRSFYFTELLHAEPNLYFGSRPLAISLPAQRKSPLEISNPNRPLFYLQLFEYMTSDNPAANCMPSSNCSHGNFKYGEDFPASLRREDIEFLALSGSDGAAKPGSARGSRSLEPYWHRRATELLSAAGSFGSGSSTSDLC